MAINLRASVRGEIIQLKRSIARNSSQLASLKGELRSRQRIYLLLGGEGVRKQRVRQRGRRRATVDWNSVLKSLPSPFNIDSIARSNAGKKKARSYLRQVVVRWVSEKKVSRTGRGRYRKV